VIQEPDGNGEEEDVWEALAAVEDGMRRADAIRVDPDTEMVRCRLCAITFGDVSDFLKHCWEIH
jgi:hypothetical protein